MSDLPRLAIVVYTYDRMETAEPTLRAALDLAAYPDPVQVHIADDGTGEDYRNRLREIAGGYERVRSITVSNSERRGYGASYNLACQATHEWNDVILALEDDWILSRPLDLLPLALTLKAGYARCIRLGNLGHTRPLTGTVMETPAGHMLRLHEDSEEHHIFAGHARLETVAFQQDVGPWPEGLRAGETEWEVCKRAASRVGVAWPMDLLRTDGDLFLHSGSRSYNQTVPEGAVHGDR